MHGPLSPAPINGAGRKELPAYVSNGIIGLRIGRCPSAQAWPLSMAIRVNTRSGGSKPPPSLLTRSPAIFSSPASGYPTRLLRSWRSNNPTISQPANSQRDFNSRWGATWRRSRFSPLQPGEPSLVCQEVWVECDTAAEIALRSIVDARNVDGIAVRSCAKRRARKSPPATARYFGRAPAGYRAAASPM